MSIRRTRDPLALALAIKSREEVPTRNDTSGNRVQYRHETNELKHRRHGIARKLAALGYKERSSNMRWCREQTAGFGIRPCNHPLCPACDRVRSSRAARETCRSLTWFIHQPVQCVLSVPCGAWRDVREGLDELGKALAVLREPAAMDACRGGVAVQKVARYESHAPLLHAHLILDIRADEVDAREINAYLARRLGHTRARFKIPDGEKALVRSTEKFSSYAHRSECVYVVERLSAVDIGALAGAMHRRRFVARWGTAAAPAEVEHARPAPSDMPRHSARVGGPPQGTDASSPPCDTSY